MPLFECSQCGCVENTAVGNFWSSRNKPTCSECAFGKWHGKFKKESAAGYHVDTDGYLWSENEVSSGKLPKHVTIVRVIPVT